jgi:hypothetical protein
MKEDRLFFCSTYVVCCAFILRSSEACLAPKINLNNIYTSSGAARLPKRSGGQVHRTIPVSISPFKTPACRSGFQPR